MRKYFHSRSAALTVVLLSASVVLPCASHARGTKTSIASEKTAIKGALKRELSHSTPDHIKVSPFTLTSIDVRSNWALAGVTPSKNQDIDPVSVLLHKVSGKWKVVTLGSNLLGAGKQYGVPRSLWKRWQLGL